jgi:hypothetical protein
MFYRIRDVFLVDLLLVLAVVEPCRHPEMCRQNSRFRGKIATGSSFPWRFPAIGSAGKKSSLPRPKNSLPYNAGSDFAGYPKSLAQWPFSADEPEWFPKPECDFSLLVPYGRENRVL